MNKHRQGRRNVRCIPSEHGEQLPKGYIPVLAGTGKAAELQRFLVSIEAFKHLRFIGWLNMGAQEFGYQQKGALTIPCDPEQFQQALDMAAGDERQFVDESGIQSQLHVN